MRLIPFDIEMAQQWDSFLENCPMSTFLHTRKFLSYHGDKFKDESIIVADDEGEWVGVLPSAKHPVNSAEVVSHPGITFGGLLHSGKLIGSNMCDAFEQICLYYKKSGFKKFTYKAIPYIYHTIPSSDDLYALFRCSASLYRRDLTCTIDLNTPLPLNNKNLSTMRRRLRKAENNGISIILSENNLEELWNILTNNLKQKYDTKPVHSYEEIRGLLSKFPDNIEVITALQNGNVVAGTIIFKNSFIYHSQYLVVTEQGAEIFALDYVLDYVINRARECHARYFDFGINNENNGLFLNNGLYLSKAKHGGRGVTQDFYEIYL